MRRIFHQHALRMFGVHSNLKYQSCKVSLSNSKTKCVEKLICLTAPFPSPDQSLLCFKTYALIVLEPWGNSAQSYRPSDPKYHRDLTIQPPRVTKQPKCFLLTLSLLNKNQGHEDERNNSQPFFSDFIHSLILLINWKLKGELSGTVTVFLSVHPQRVYNTVVVARVWTRTFSPATNFFWLLPPFFRCSLCTSNNLHEENFASYKPLVSFCAQDGQS